MTNQYDTSRCPLCGGPNDCHMADGRDPMTCWCHQSEVPKALLEMVPDEQRGQACICQRCIAAYRET